MNALKRYMLEPMSTLTSLAGGLAALVGTIWLLWLSRGETGKMLSLLVYGAMLIALYVASTLLHGARLPARQRMWLNRLDHAAIFLLIAGTYTAIVANLFPAVWRWPTLALVWGVALTGVAVKLGGRRIHGGLNVGIYLILGWVGALPPLLVPAIGARVPWAGWGWLLLGGLIFNAGFVVYARRRPNPWPHFGHHELWHLFVIGGTLCHFLFMLWYVVPAPVAG